METVVDNVQYAIELTDLGDIAIRATNFITFREYSGVFTVKPTQSLTPAKMFECISDALMDRQQDIIARDIKKSKVGDAIDVTITATTYVGEFILAAHLKPAHALTDASANSVKIAGFAHLLDTYGKRIASLEEDFALSCRFSVPKSITINNAGIMTAVTNVADIVPPYAQVDDLRRYLRVATIYSITIQATTLTSVPAWVYDCLFEHTECTYVVFTNYFWSTLDRLGKMIRLATINISSAPILTNIDAIANIEAKCTVTLNGIGAGATFVVNKSPRVDAKYNMAGAMPNITFNPK